MYQSKFHYEFYHKNKMWMKLLKISLLDEIWDSLELNRINLNVEIDELLFQFIKERQRKKYKGARIR